MRITSVRHIDGPNVYLYRPILAVRIDLEDLTEKETKDFPGFSENLLRILPGLHEHHCAKGRPGGFAERLFDGTYFGHVTEHVAIELAARCGLDVHYGKTVLVGDPGQYEMVMECKSFECQAFLVHQARQLVEALLQQVGDSFDVSRVLHEATEILRSTELGPSTQAIMEEAVRRGIPVRRLNQGSLVQLGWGFKRRLLEATITEQTSAVAVDIACDKELTKHLLDEAGVPVPMGDVVTSVEAAVDAFRRLTPPVVVKPLDANQGKGVTLDIRNEDEVREATQMALEYSRSVIVEAYVSGRNIRCLVVGGKFVAASERLPAMVFGDGKKTIQELVDEVNADPMRGDDHERPLTKVKVDAICMHTLAKQGWTLRDVPGHGVRVLLRESANLSTGGQAVDVTEEVGSEIRSIAERAARMIGLDVCGIDMIVPTFANHTHHPKSGLQDGECYIIEVNAAPGIRMHHHPSFGDPRPVASAIVDSLFPGQSNGRIPVISVTGTNGKTTTTRLIAHALRFATGKTVGYTTTSGVWVGDRQIAKGDTTGPASARMVLSDPAVQAAVLETARGGMVRGGLAYDKADVAVLTNITPDHLGQDGIETVEELVHVKSLVGECVCEDGTVVLNADDDRLVEASQRFTAQIVYFSTSASNSVIRRHLGLGGTAFYENNGWIVEARGSLSWPVVRTADVSITMGGTAQFQIENALAAAAALRAAGCMRQQVARGLSSFESQVDNLGRCSVFRLPNGANVVLDYGHNPDGFRRVGDWLLQVSHQQLLGVIGVPGDRADSVVREAAAQAARVFDALYVKEDHDRRGREPGEIAMLMTHEISSRCPEKPVHVILDEIEALEQAMKDAAPDDIVVLFYEHLDGALQAVQAAGGTPVKAPFVRRTMAMPL